MATTLQKIKDIEDEMNRTQKNKATMLHLGVLKARLAKLKRELLQPSGGGGGGGEGFDVSKTGDARVGLIGFPSVGKSTLLTKLTDAESAIASYEFTTLTCVPGVIHYKGARIQLLDLPGIIEGAKDGKGRGRQVLAVARTCSLMLIVLDAMKPLVHKRILEREVEGFGIRLNKRPANISFHKRDKGGISFTATVPLTHIDEEGVKAILHEYRIPHAQVCFRQDATEDEFIDIIEGNRHYCPCVYVLNKIDQITIEELDLIDRIPHYVPISAHLGWNLDELLEKMWEYLGLIRIYTKPKGMIPDYSAPIVLRNQEVCGVAPTVEVFCNKIHKGILPLFKHALVWGASVRHFGQRMGLAHTLMDEDVVQIVKRCA
eukprot:gnl/Spiro4/5728_TR2929_c0_g1_i1.p2 gnl/Spiro4/5728_TR2929_c0_g1~~gnl/Spiro4/5728_TR2929_c0_g1_i1.p2  ORF type:complete len:374 (-),score=99.13 gnl/Spiro4/5728_TR2929_c0_g1_i1:82-1203(-)